MSERNLAWAFMQCGTCGSVSHAPFSLVLHDLSETSLKRLEGTHSNAMVCGECADRRAGNPHANHPQGVMLQVNGLWLLEQKVAQNFDTDASTRPDQDRLRHLEHEVERLKSVNVSRSPIETKNLILAALRAINPQFADILGLSELMNWPTGMVAAALLYALGEAIRGSNYEVSKLFVQDLKKRLAEWLRKDDAA